VKFIIIKNETGESLEINSNILEYIEEFWSIKNNPNTWTSNAHINIAANSLVTGWLFFAARRTYIFLNIIHIRFKIS
jgi:hypothetical protein